MVSNSPSDVHTTPAGRYPDSGPKPSKVAVLLYYVSCLLIIIGSIMLIRYGFFKDKVKKLILTHFSYTIEAIFIFNY